MSSTPKRLLTTLSAILAALALFFGTTHPPADAGQGDRSTVASSVTLSDQEMAAVAFSAASKVPYGKEKSYPFWKSSTSSIDPLRYYKRSCVSYVGWRLLHTNNVRFYYSGAAWQWPSWASSHGYKLLKGTDRKKVKRGYIAYWYRGYKKGHVAWVEDPARKTSKGIRVHVREANWNNPNGYGERDIMWSEPTLYIAVPIK